MASRVWGVDQMSGTTRDLIRRRPFAAPPWCADALRPLPPTATSSRRSNQAGPGRWPRPAPDPTTEWRDRSFGSSRPGGRARAGEPVTRRGRRSARSVRRGRRVVSQPQTSSLPNRCATNSTSTPGSAKWLRRRPRPVPPQRLQGRRPAGAPVRCSIGSSTCAAAPTGVARRCRRSWCSFEPRQHALVVHPPEPILWSAPTTPVNALSQAHTNG